MTLAEGTTRSRLPLRRALAPSVVALGVVSLLTDVSSEMIYPLLPVFLTTVLGTGAVALGAIEGVAEATASLLKIVSGRLSDRSRRRTPFVLAGYTVSGLARPAIGLAATWPFVLACRFADRVGKGLRTAPRDALIADWTPPERRGTAFGLHRGMDHLGAVLGPLVAAGLLALGLGYRAVFLAAIVPALAVVAVILVFIREPRQAVADAGSTALAHDGLPRRWPALLGAAFLAALGTPADAFLLLLLTERGLSGIAVAALWSAHNVVRFSATFGAGLLADRVPRVPLVALGWSLRAALLPALALAGGNAPLIALFLAYGAAAALTEPAERAFVAGLVGRDARGAAFGAYHAAVGLGALPAGLLLGALWDGAGALAALTTAAAILASAALLLPLARR